MSIQNIVQKIKRIRPETQKNLFVIGIIIIVAFSSFALGRLSVATETFQPLIMYPEEVVERAERAVDGGEQVVVASSRGTKYHYPWCPGAIDMSANNKIEFSSIRAAQEAGYEPASNCDGLPDVGE